MRNTGKELLVKLRAMMKEHAEMVKGLVDG